MEIKSIHQRLEYMLLEKGISKSQVSSNASLTKDLSLDSLDFAELIMAIELEFEIRILESDWHKINTVSDLERYILHRYNEESKSKK